MSAICDTFERISTELAKYIEMRKKAKAPKAELDALSLLQKGFEELAETCRVQMEKLETSIAEIRKKLIV